MTHLTLTIIFGILLFPAIFAVFIPMLPAISYMFIMAVLFLTIFVSEIFLNKSRTAALKAAAGSFAGAVGGVLLNLALAITFFTLFIIFTFF